MFFDTTTRSPRPSTDLELDLDWSSNRIRLALCVLQPADFAEGSFDVRRRETVKPSS
jgi:hypothetical protein